MFHCELISTSQPFISSSWSSIHSQSYWLPALLKVLDFSSPVPLICACVLTDICGVLVSALMSQQKAKDLPRIDSWVKWRWVEILVSFNLCPCPPRQWISIVSVRGCVPPPRSVCWSMVQCSYSTVQWLAHTAHNWVIPGLIPKGSVQFPSAVLWHHQSWVM